MTPRLLLLALSALIMAIATARAGDASRLTVLGFSPDLGVFAFEEYGIQDGSGFPYANRFYIATDEDRYLPGTPIRVRLDDERATVEEARAVAASQGAAATGLSDATLARTPGLILAFSPSTDLSRDGSHLRVLPRAVFPPVDAPILLALEHIPFADEDACFGLRDAVMGFRLRMTEERVGGTTRVLSEDLSVPASRNCPSGYRIAGAITAEGDREPAVLAVLIEIEQLGFEGPDRRWMAVTTTLQ